MRYWHILLMLSMAMFGCSDVNHFRVDRFESVKKGELPTDFKIPAKIWDLIELLPGEKSADGPSNRGIFYSSIKVFLTEKNTHILKSPAYVIDLPRGGGSVDLAQYLTGDPGTFFVGFELPEEFNEGKNLKVFYLSHARKRKIDDRVYGAGCNQYFDISKNFLQMMKTEGIKANTTRQRHLTLLSGHYIFSIVKESQIFLTQVSILDSRHKNLLCEVQ